MTPDILIVDDEDDIRNLIDGILEDEGYVPRQAANAKEAYAAIQKSVPDIVIQDIWLQGSSEDGLEILEKVKKEHPHVAFIMISGHGTIETAVSAIKKGAYDFIEKPFKSDRLIVMITRALETVALKKENEKLKKRAESLKDEILGESDNIKNLQQVLDRVAQSNSRVLLTGEAGTGKNLAAHYIHANSKRGEKPLMSINCVTEHPERLEEELFGTTKGYNNEREKQSIFELVNGGTLLLDEVAHLPIELQGKLVRVLQEESYQKLGSSERHTIDIRFIATTQDDLEDIIAQGKFREDLYYRLNVVPIQMPPLRERRNDIPALIKNIMKSMNKTSEKTTLEFDDKAMIAMQSYEWPGNMRQLRNMLEWILIMSDNTKNKQIGISDLPPEISGETQSSGKSSDSMDIMSLTLREARESFEKEYLLKQVKRFGGNISRTAQFVGMERSALHRKLKLLDIMPDDKNTKSSGDTKTRKSA